MYEKPSVKEDERHYHSSLDVFFNQNFAHARQHFDEKSNARPKEEFEEDTSSSSSEYEEE